MRVQQYTMKYFFRTPRIVTVSLLICACTLTAIVSPAASAQHAPATDSSTISTIPAEPPAAAATVTCTSSTPAASRPTVKKGDSGSCVSTLQSSLVARGYSVGTAGVDGSFGNGTYYAVVAFQSDNSLGDDGVVGPATWTKLVSSYTYNPYQGPNHSSRIILTYDDCPTDIYYMKSMSNAAKSVNVGIVLAPTGDCVSAGMFDAGYARARGQYVINHSISHPDLTKLSFGQITAQLSAPGIATTYGRPPFGASNSTVQAAYTYKGMRQWYWTKDTNDWQGYSQSYLTDYVIKHAAAGDTILMHMQHKAFNKQALFDMVGGIRARGLELCKPYPGTTPVRLPYELPCS